MSIMYNLQDLENKIQCFYELMIISKQNGNLADYEKFTILYNSAKKDKERYFSNKEGEK